MSRRDDNRVLLRGGPLGAALTATAERGFARLAWRPDDATLADGLTRQGCRRTWQAERDAGDAAVNAITTGEHSLFDLAGPSRAARWLARERSLALVEAAALLGPAVGVILWASPPRPITDYEGQFNALYDSLAVIVEACEKRQVSLWIENPAVGLLLSPLELRALVDELRSGYVGVCLRPDHADQLGAASDWVRILGRRIGCVHLPAPGHPDFIVADRRGLMAALDEAGFQGPIVYDDGSAGH